MVRRQIPSKLPTAIVWRHWCTRLGAASAWWRWRDPYTLWEKQPAEGWDVTPGDRLEDLARSLDTIWINLGLWHLKAEVLISSKQLHQFFGLLFTQKKLQNSGTLVFDCFWGFLQRRNPTENLRIRRCPQRKGSRPSKVNRTFELCCLAASSLPTSGTNSSRLGEGLIYGWSGEHSSILLEEIATFCRPHGTNVKFRPQFVLSDQWSETPCISLSQSKWSRSFFPLAQCQETRMLTFLRAGTRDHDTKEWLVKDVGIDAIPTTYRKPLPDWPMFHHWLGELMILQAPGLIKILVLSLPGILGLEKAPPAGRIFGDSSLQSSPEHIFCVAWIYLRTS